MFLSVLRPHKSMFSENKSVQEQENRRIWRENSPGENIVLGKMWSNSNLDFSAYLR